MPLGASDGIDPVFVRFETICIIGFHVYVVASRMVDDHDTILKHAYTMVFTCTSLDNWHQSRPRHPFVRALRGLAYGESNGIYPLLPDGSISLLESEIESTAGNSIEVPFRHRICFLANGSPSARGTFSRNNIS